MKRDIDKLAQEARQRIHGHPGRDFSLSEMMELQNGDDSLMNKLVRAVRFGYALGYRHAMQDAKEKTRCAQG